MSFSLTLLLIPSSLLCIWALATMLRSFRDHKSKRSIMLRGPRIELKGQIPPEQIEKILEKLKQTGQREEEERKQVAEQVRLEEEREQATHPGLVWNMPRDQEERPRPAALEERKQAAKQFPDTLARRSVPENARREEKDHHIPAGVLIDNVHFTLTGPFVLAPGTAHELQFWLHVEQQRSSVLAAASVLHGFPQSEMAVKSEGPYPLQRGSRISVRLRIDGLRCFDSHKWITWTGDIGNTAFVVEVPQGTSEGAYPGRASIRLNGCEIAKMSFLVRVGSLNPAISEIPTQATTYRSAFASYASEDRADVLSRVQGMEAAYKGLDVFVDVINLRSGQNWERELVERISKSDVFYLFWCRHAMSSDWVNKEWHWALAAKGQDFVDPIPLETPTLAPPPEELAAKHFNDPLLAFISAAGGVHSPVIFPQTPRGFDPEGDHPAK